MKLRNITPTLSVDNVAETIDFYLNVLQFELEQCVGNDLDGIDTEMEEGTEYVYATVSKDDVSFTFLANEHFQLEVPVLRDCPKGGSVLFYIDIDDIQEVYDRLKDQVQIVKPLETTWYGMREFFFQR